MSKERHVEHSVRLSQQRKTIEGTVSVLVLKKDRYSKKCEHIFFLVYCDVSISFVVFNKKKEAVALSNEQF